MADNTFTKDYQDGSTLTESQLDTGYKSLQPALDNLAVATTGSSDKDILRSNGSGNSPSWNTIDELVERRGPDTIHNLGLAASVSSGALVVSLKTADGSDPSSSDPVEIGFSGSGTTNVQQQDRSITSALSLTINASATLGTDGTSARRVFIYALDHGAGTVTLGVSSFNSFEDGLKNTATTAISSSADSAGVLYASAVLSVTPRLIGSVEAAQNSSDEWQTPTDLRVTNQIDFNSRGVAEKIFKATTRGDFDATVTSPDIGLSNSSGSFSSTSATFVDVTNLSVTITTNGRPVEVKLVPDGSTTASYVGYDHGGGFTGVANTFVNIVRGTSSIGVVQLQGYVNSGFTDGYRHGPGSINITDNVAEGSYTYKIQVRQTPSAGTGGAAVVEDCKLQVQEI